MGAEDRDRYYADIPKRLSRANRFARLSELVATTHREQPRYEPRRHVYPWVDLQPNGMLRSIYTGEEYEPVEFIREDFRIERERLMWRRERLGTEATIATPSAREALGLLEERLPYNCEHVVPQSWFDHREPMRGDLHHLFACEGRCNSFRSNTPYFEFPQFDEAVRRGCGMTKGSRFEPSNGKDAGDALLPAALPRRDRRCRARGRRGAARVAAGVARPGASRRLRAASQRRDLREVRQPQPADRLPGVGGEDRLHPRAGVTGRGEITSGYQSTPDVILSGGPESKDLL